MIYSFIHTRLFKKLFNRFTDCKLSPQRSEGAKISGVVLRGAAVTPSSQEHAWQRVEHDVGSGDTEVVGALTAGGGADRLAVCNGSLSSSDSTLQPRLNERSVITVTARCAWQPAFLFLQRCCGFRPRGPQLAVFFLESVKKAAGEEVERSGFLLRDCLNLKSWKSR